MFDDAEILAVPPASTLATPSGAPRPFERLDGYVLRLAGCYGTSLATFCRHGLGDAGEVATRRTVPPRRALERQPAGTGVPVHRLRNMTCRRHAQLMIEVRRSRASTPRSSRKGLRKFLDAPNSWPD